jgi:non-ribosomal peptide synthetase component F
VSIIHPDRDPSRAPLFQVMFALQNVPSAALQAAGLLVTPLELTSGTSKFDLTLFATEVDEGLRLNLEYSTDLFDASTADRMLAHFQILLDEIIADPDQLIGAIPMLTPEERRQVVLGWNPVEQSDDAADFDESDDDDLESEMYDAFNTELVANE